MLKMSHIYIRLLLKYMQKGGFAQREQLAQRNVGLHNGTGYEIASKESIVWTEAVNRSTFKWRIPSYSPTSPFRLAVS